MTHLVTRIVFFLLVAGASTAPAGIVARYVRVDNPTSYLMSWQEIEVISGGQNIVAKKGDWFSGSWRTPEGRKPNQGAAMTDGQKDPAQRGPTFDTGDDQVPGAWFEIDLQAATPIEQVILYASRFAPGAREYLDKGQRVLTLLDGQRRVLWAGKWDRYDRKRFPNGIYRFQPQAGDAKTPLDGTVVPPGEPQRIPMAWLLDVGPERLPPDAPARVQRFAARSSPHALTALADEFFRLLEPLPELAEARRLYAAGKPAEALQAWKRYWFAKMARVNSHLGYGGTFIYRGQAEDLAAGLRVTIAPTKVAASRFTPGRIHWVDLPDDPDGRRNALADTAQLALVNNVNRALMLRYGETGERKYLEHWAEIMDDWAMNFFTDADASPYNVKDLFVMIPANAWGKMMEELADLAQQRPELIDALPAATLARVQLVCLEQYGPAYWRQARETVFNHNTSAIQRWGLTLPYIDEFRPATRLAREWRQHLERWMTLGTAPDGSMVEIGDEGHFSIPMVLGCDFKRLEDSKPDWFTPGWRNRAWEYFDNLHKYVFRHAAPGGYDHRHGHRINSVRFTDLTNEQYSRDGSRRELLLDRRKAIYAIPEVRRILDAVCSVSAGRPELDPKTPWWARRVEEPKIAARAAALEVLGDERPGEPHIASDWMPYTGSYYFRSGWAEGNAFLAMLAKGSRGGSEPQSPSWSYGLVYQHDYGFPLMRAETFTIDGLHQNPLGGKMTFTPGTKTSSLTYAQRDPAPHRWHASERFAFGEAVFAGIYQRVGFKYEPGWLAEPGAGKLDLSENRIDHVRANRQVLQLRGSRLFIVTDTAHFADESERAKTHAFGEALTLMLSTREKGATQPFSVTQLAIDEQGRTLATRNPDGPNVTLHQFADFPFSYKLGREAKPDFSEYAAELTGNTGIAAQGVAAAWQTAGDCALVTLISSSPAGGEERVQSVEPLNRGAAVAGFHATLRDGSQIWYQAAAANAKLTCGAVTATAETLAVIRDRSSVLSGMVLGCTELSVAGRSVTVSHPDFEFSALNPEPRALAPQTGTSNVQRSTSNAQLNTEHRTLNTLPIFRPIASVRFTPDRNVFTDALTVAMTCATPGVEIRYTIDGTPPLRSSQLYTGPVRITETSEFAARAYRVGPGGKALPADEFEINGTRFTVPGYGWFYKKPLKPAVAVDEAKLQPGLNCEHLQGPWTRLYSQGHWLPAVRTTVAEREMDLREARSKDYYGARFNGYLRVPDDGVYTFHAPPEYVLPDTAASYDLRVYVDGEEWYLTQWWHGHGTWSVPLAKGLHTFEVDFADARTTPWKKSDLWRYYPRPWVVYPGDPGPVLLSGPGLDKTRIPAAWLLCETR